MDKLTIAGIAVGLKKSTITVEHWDGYTREEVIRLLLNVLAGEPIAVESASQFITNIE
jgi:hypothetical protein